jgi:hypothetical protein
MSREALKQEKRLRRQFAALARTAPIARRVVNPLLHNRMRLVRVPLAILLVAGSFLAILPVFGLWMLPAGLMLLAIDVPLLRPRVSAALIRLRRWWSLRRQSRRGARQGATKTGP